VETPLFATMLVEPPDAEEEDEVDVHATLTRPSHTIEPSPPLQEPITTPLQAQLATPLTPPQEQPTITSESDMTLLNTLIETCTILSLKVAQLEQDKIDQALEILKLKKRVKKNCYGFSRGCIQTGEKIAEIDADNDVTLVDVETQVDLGDELQGRKDNDNAAIKEVSAAKPTVFDDEEVIMTMAQTLINMKAEKARLLDEQMAKRLHDEEVEQAAAREKQEKDNLEKAKVLQQQLYIDKQENIDWNVVVEQMKEKHLENIKKYQSLKRKPISIAQARKNMIVYLKNMAGYKMEHFKSMTYDKVRPIFEREYNKVQTLFKPDKDVEEPQRKRVAEETLLRESFKKLKAVEVSSSHSTQDTLTIDPKEMSEEGDKNMLEIVLDLNSRLKPYRVSGITQAYQRFEDMLKDFDRDDMDVLWRLVKEKFSLAVPTVDKEKSLWKLHSNCGVHQVSSTIKKHDMYMLTEKDYPLLNGVMTLMLSTRLQVEEDSEMARDLLMKIFMKANQPKSRSLDTPSK
nr:hypothetical protein [Tanacetum cinerariifolium]